MLVAGAIPAILMSLSVLFKIQHWPYANIMGYLTILILLFIYLPLFYTSGVKHQETKSENTFKGILNCWDSIGSDIVKNLVDKGLYDVNIGGLQGAIRDHAYASKYLYLYLD